MKQKLLAIALCLATSGLVAQPFTKADTLRGALRLERECFDVTYYHINLDFDLDERFIKGYVDMNFEVKKPSRTIQVDLYDNMNLTSVKWGSMDLKFNRVANAIFIDFPSALRVGSSQILRMEYNGKPTVAKNAPWDGGFVFKTDSKGKHFVGVACEGDGASLWWPNKDHLSDEPDSLRLTGRVPSDLMLVSNGNLEKKTKLGDKTEYTWKVSYPINNYNVSVNIADYFHFSEIYTNREGRELNCDYYVLKENKAKAKEQFKQVIPMLKIFEAYFGPFPFWNDGYALVETPYLGMEHQTAIAYGNQYKNGYLGRQPEGVDFDYIIIHETGHEYWGNHVSMKDIADMWIHESFCTYSEAVYVEATYGPDIAQDYLNYQREFITNNGKILGVPDVNNHGNSTDMYYKGAWMLHSIRNTINDDQVWWNCIRGIQDEFGMQTVSGDQVIRLMNDYTNIDLEPIFKQYLGLSKVPRLEYRKVKKWGRTIFEYRWEAQTKGFNMPVEIIVDGKAERLYPRDDWQSIEYQKIKPDQIEIGMDKFLISSIELQ